MITKTEAENELNARGYYLQSTIPIEPPPVIPPPEPSPNGDNVIDKYGTMIVIALALMFMIAIYPEGNNKTASEGEGI